MYPTELDKAWAAGLFDGEGCVCALRSNNRSKGRENYALHVTVGMTHLDTLQRLQRLWGGQLYTKVVRGNRRPAWNWTLTSEGIEPFLRAILPFSYTKQSEILLGLAALKDWGFIPNGHVRQQGMPIELLALRKGYYLALQEAKRCPV
jgi:hypothetical protein